MIRFLEHKEINKEKWDECIKSSLNPCIFIYSWYLDVVCKNWDALVLNDYEAVFPLASKSKYNINYILQPFFTRYFGVFSKNKISEELVENFLSAIPDKFKQIEFCLHEGNVLTGNKNEIREKKYQLLNLKNPYEVIEKEYSSNSKRNIKKALKANLKIRLNVTPEEIVKLFKTTKGGELGVFKVQDYETLIELMNACLLRNKGQSIGVYDGNDLCAAGFFMYSDNRFVFLKSGATEVGKSKGAMFLLFDYFIRENSGKQYLLDFGGSSVNSVAHFYSNFGAKDCLYLQVKKNNLSRLVKWVKALKS